MSRVIITGGNRGIGLELARGFHVRGDEVVVGCRRASAALSDLGVEFHEGLDVADPASIDRFSEALGDRPVDVLVNNAGVLSVQRLGEIEGQSIEDILTQFKVNALGPLLLTQALLPRMHPGSRLAIITSRMGSIADNTSGGSYGYRMSKVAVNMAGVSLAHDLAERGIAVGLLHPGFVRTEMTARQGNVDAPQAAAQLLERIDEIRPETSGSFRHANGDPLPW
ncbi:SDR family oxidoreductase [Gammaproteobacteria bacterium AB-CW1]|uniref:SDR family oxidoreductase n=1 Tax=Natronospira elongata TaxID=3110268 RepID=A0AAP6MJN9_9GAMM|nr:SDR family oxidoreductase [Gammaproteobacteria bacterium AB-CW1]